MLDDLRAELATAHGFTVDVGHLTIFGTCGACS
jgi:Fe2+ or Zn2+ uptake regulation protein